MNHDSSNRLVGWYNFHWIWHSSWRIRIYTTQVMNVGFYQSIDTASNLWRGLKCRLVKRQEKERKKNKIFISEQFSVRSKSQHINKKLSMRVFCPQLVTEQRLEGCQIVEKENCSKLSTFRVLHTLFSAIFHKLKYDLIQGDHLCERACMQHATAYAFGQNISAKYDA